MLRKSLALLVVTAMPLAGCGGGGGGSSQPTSTATADGGASQSDPPPENTTDEEEPPLPAISISVEPGYLNEGSSKTITVSLSEASDRTVTATLSSSGSAIRDQDYSLDATSVSIPSGQLSVPVEITAFVDQYDEVGDEAIISLTEEQNASIDATSNSVSIKLDDWPGAIQFGTTSSEACYGVALATDGSLIIAGLTYGALGLSTSTGNPETFVAKYSRHGERQWLIQEREDPSGWAEDVVTTENNDIYVSGKGAISGSPVNHSVARYDLSGTKIWRTITQGHDARRIALDASSNLYTTAAINADAASSMAIGIKALSDTGIVLWDDIVSASTGDKSLAVTVSTSGEIYLTGSTTSDLDGGGPPSATQDPVLVKYASDGTRLWTKHLRTLTTNPNDDFLLFDLLPAADGVIVAGVVSDVTTSNGQAFIARLNDSGEVIWSRDYGGEGDETFRRIRQLPNGSYIATGWTESDTDTTDGYLVRVDPDSGDLIWSQSFGSPESDYVLGLAVSKRGEIYVCGDTQGDLYGNSNTGGGPSASDIFVMKFDETGERI